MSDEEKNIKANAIFEDICGTLSAMGRTFLRKTDKDYAVDFNVPSNDIPIRIIISLDVENERIKLESCLPINILPEKHFDIALAVNEVNCIIVNGSFDFDCIDGSLFFKMANSYKNSELNTELYKYMIETARETVDLYNDKFLKVARNLISLREFLKEEGF